MSNQSGAIAHVTDTALLVAGCRAVEAENPDALVRDPFAARLAGERWLAMFRAVPHPAIMGFGIAMRTRFIDELIIETISSAGLKTVVCVGAGLDTRPWRLELPARFRWVEVDFPEMLDYKESILSGERLHCRRERLAADLNDPEQRARIYTAVGSEPALMLTEGLLMYLPATTVRALAVEAPRESGIQHWITDVITTSFSQAIGGGGSRTVQHVQAEDHLTGEQILETIAAQNWRTAAHRSYVRDLAFATERIKQLMGNAPAPPKPPLFDANEPAGVYRFARA
jgi:O-methyltransferase involved in polyketide biosynthesis